MDGRVVDGNRVGRITRDGEITEFPISTPNASPINIAVGPDKNVWFTMANKLGYITAEGKMGIVDLPTPNGRPTGLSAGSDRQPPKRLFDQLWFTESGANKVGFLKFQ
jgi:virginiamycin B lyase